MNKKIVIRLFILMLVLLFIIGIEPSASAQSIQFFKQETNISPLKSLTETELAELDDPFFNLVLKEHPTVTNLAEIETLIQPDESQRETFVVDEQIVDETPGQSRRAVLSFKGNNQGQSLTRNVMLSVEFNSQDFVDQQEVIEAWGWDSQRGRYNYYRLDTNQTDTLIWKFRGSSENADTLTPSQRKNTCMACHINGAPVMKELFLPWTNWHSFSSEATYLEAGNSKSWPVAQNQRIQNGLTGAEQLEGLILSGVRRFNSSRIDQLTPKIGETVRVTEGKRLLKPLFETTEFNIISSRQSSRLHPFSNATLPSISPIEIPNSFFLNAELIAGGGGAGYKGLGITESRQFSQEVKVEPAEYEQLLQEFGVQLAGQKPGDAHFAWLVPEASHVDNDWVDQLMKKDIVSPDFVAAVMAIDLETPILSSARQRLLQFIPEQFTVEPVNTLTELTIANLEQTNPSVHSPAGQFLERLKQGNATEDLRTKVQQYLEREKTQLENPETRFDELQRLYRIAIQHRQSILRNQVLKTLDETQGTLLFPVP